jgi:chitosanase
MILATGIKDLIEHILNEEETGSVTGDYGEVCTYLDGHDGTRQITYGRSQTTEQGNLKDLIALYVSKGGLYASFFTSYVPVIGKAPLAADAAFKQTLRLAGNDPIMRAAEDQFFDTDYFTPALKWASAYGFTLALSMLVIYDSFIQSGGVLNFLRARFEEVPPSAGGDEKVWITEYADVRHNWLRLYDDPANPAKSALIRASCYRTGDLKRAIQAGNWDLSQRPFIANGAEVSA